MRILLKSIEIIDTRSVFHKQRKNILIENACILYIGDDDSFEFNQVFDGQNFKISIGWFDMGVHLSDPGNEYRQTINDTLLAAKVGGFTGIACLSDTSPLIQSKNIVSSLINSSSNVTSLFPIAMVSHDGKGMELTEMIDLSKAGAIAFADSDKPIWHTGLLLKALQYAQHFDGLIIQHPEDIELSKHCQINEGVVSTLLGLKGFPELAEELMVLRDIEIVKYTGGKIHFSKISTKRSLELIKTAQSNGLAVTCSVAGHHLAINDSALTNFDTSFKVRPPFRASENSKALIDSLNDGTIDVIVSDHCPQDVEVKNLEFDLAEFGAIGLETLFGVIFTFTQNKVDLGTLIEKISINPRKLLGLTIPEFKEGELANFTIFSTDLEWEVTKKTLTGVYNSPFLGTILKGKPVAVLNNGFLEIL